MTLVHPVESDGPASRFGLGVSQKCRIDGPGRSPVRVLSIDGRNRNKVSFRKRLPARSPEILPAHRAAEAKVRSLRRARSFGSVVFLRDFHGRSHIGTEGWSGDGAAIPIPSYHRLARVYRRRSSCLRTSSSRDRGAAAAWLPRPFSRSRALHSSPRSSPVQTIFICWRAAVSAVLFLIPLRRYFVREMARLLPYLRRQPSECSFTGEKRFRRPSCFAGNRYRGVYDPFVPRFKVWKEYVDSVRPRNAFSCRPGPDGIPIRRHKLHSWVLAM